jgi:hypothetical protein
MRSKLGAQAWGPTRVAQVVILLVGSSSASIAIGQTIDPAFSSSYSFTDLGSVPGVPSRYGGLTLKFDDPNTLIIGGAANGASGALYSIGVTRDANDHITGFVGEAQVFAAGAFNDGGVAYGPNNVLFLARWPSNELGQTKPGSTITDKIIDLDPFNIVSSPGGGTFVPDGFPNEGHYKLVSWSGGQWYDITFQPDGNGTFDIDDVTPVPTSNLPGGPEGFVYIPTGSPEFDTPSMLVSEFSASAIAAYEIDSNGDPIVATRQLFMSGLSGAEGAFTDPLTGDFLFSTFGGGDRVVVITGFATPEPEPGPGPGPEPVIPLPAAVLMFPLGAGVALVMGTRMRRRAICRQEL